MPPRLLHACPHLGNIFQPRDTRQANRHLSAGGGLKQQERLTLLSRSPRGGLFVHQRAILNAGNYAGLLRQSHDVEDEGDAAVAVHRLQAARARQAALNGDVLPRARMVIDPAVAGYASGQLPLVSVIEAVQALWRVQSDLIAADTELGLAWARLGRAIGSYEAIIP